MRLKIDCLDFQIQTVYPDQGQGSTKSMQVNVADDWSISTLVPNIKSLLRWRVSREQMIVPFSTPIPKIVVFILLHHTNSRDVQTVLYCTIHLQTRGKRRQFSGSRKIFDLLGWLFFWCIPFAYPTTQQPDIVSLHPCTPCTPFCKSHDLENGCMESMTLPGSAASPTIGKDGLATTTPTTDSSAEANLLSPPFWKTNFHDEPAASVERRSNRSQIQLEDHTEEFSDQFRALWAKGVAVDDYIIIRGAVGFGAYVVWNCTVDILDGGSMKIRRRYSEFDKLRHNLVQSFPQAGAALPEIPPKSILHKFQPKFLEKRKAGLDHFLK
ncbi:hypothetical protein EJ08DRAFT_717764 [Tothia fuscella]|uniref:Endosomal/vacuolar adapter protein YPT35 n=1 Tax=Tothia fuscella TaxID=1048955 RepID=A0A9P4U3M2_9PEZI|nr:hypothetical protein EJ08DRAFT_717764 [Tothia fuscella]